jgi:hypothetical protein
VGGLLVRAHHSEPVDPVLLGWLTETIHAILGIGPAVAVVLIAIVVLAVPAGIAFFAMRQRRRV